MCFAETGSTDSQAEASLGTEKRSLRIKRRQQQHRGGDADQDGDDAVHTTLSRDTITADASSPVPSPSRTPQSSPTGRGRRVKVSSLRSRLADQSGPDSGDSDAADAAAAEGAAVPHSDAKDNGFAVAQEPVVPARNPQKRKRPQQQQQQSTPAVAIATSVQLTRSTEGSDHLGGDAMTEHSRSSEAATPVGRHTRRGQGQGRTQQKPEALLLGAQQTEQELDSAPGGALRRTGRQRKLTPAAAAAVEDFPSLYRNPAKPLTAAAQKMQKARKARSLSFASDPPWQEDSEGAAVAVASPRRGQTKQMHAVLGGGVSQVHMSQLVRSGVLPAGTHELLFMGSLACQVEVLSDGIFLFPPSPSLSLLPRMLAQAIETVGLTMSFNCTMRSAVARSLCLYVAGCWLLCEMFRARPMFCRLKQQVQSNDGHPNKASVMPAGCGTVRAH